MKRKNLRKVEFKNGQWSINYSTAAAIQSCPTKAHFIVEHGIQTESLSSEFGSALHASLAGFYSLHPKEREVGYMKELFEKYCATSAVPIPQTTKEDARSIENGIKIIENWFALNKDTPYVTYTDESGPWVERDFDLEFSDNIRLFGTIDLVLVEPFTHRVMVCDHKTTKVISNFEKRVKPNHQLTGYIWALNKMGIKCDSAMLQAIQVAKTIHASFNIETTRTTEDFKEWARWLASIVGQWNYYNDSGFFPMNGGSECSLFAGCKFQSVCAAQASDRLAMLKDLSTKEETVE